MTNLTEAKLAREAEICYGVIALSTDYDCWHDSHDDVSVEAIIAIIKANVATAKQIIRRAVRRIAGERSLPLRARRSSTPSSATLGHLRWSRRGNLELHHREISVKRLR